jgi:hypothetical protein
MQIGEQRIRFGGAPRIHGELLKLGIQISQATVAKLCLPKIPSGRKSLKLAA